MLNELNESLAILKGERINPQHIYRTLFILVKYYKFLGYTHIKTKEHIIEWAKKYNIKITDDLNYVIQKVFRGKYELVTDVVVHISERDIKEIKERFDKYNTRLVAFAMLCFAKKYADQNGVFTISIVGLSNWVGINQSNITSRTIRELIDFGYIEKKNVRVFKQIVSKQKVVSKNIIYRIKVDCINSGGHIFYDKNIREEFDKMFCCY